MDIRPTRIFQLGDRAVTVEFGNAMSDDLNDASIALANYLNDHPFAGMDEAVAAIASTTIFYDPIVVESHTTTESAFDSVIGLINEALDNATVPELSAGKLVEIPARFSGGDAPDLDLVAETAGITREEVVDIFLATEYRVFMLGFLPGFPYLGVVDERIAVPRRKEPRTLVAKGSIGIAGRQTGIYPSASPGGWQIIGRTAVELVGQENDRSFLFAPGDRVRFVRG